MVVETERLRLRFLTEEDIPHLVSGLNDWSIAQWLVSAPFPYTQQDAKQFIEPAYIEDKEILNIKFAITNHDTREFLGVITLLSEENGRAELGYWLKSTAQGRGYMREAIEGIIKYAKMKVFKLICFATIDPRNFKSEKCLLAAGFHFVKQYSRESPRRNGSIETSLFELTWPV